MAIMLETALRVVDPKNGSTLEDKIEAYQFLSDNWHLEYLSPEQQKQLNHLVEQGLIQTAPWRG